MCGLTATRWTSSSSAATRSPRSRSTSSCPAPARSTPAARREAPRSAEARRGRGVEDGVDVEAVVAVEVRQVAGLAEMLDTERADTVAAHAAEPRERGRMAVDKRDEAGVGRQRRQQLLDMGNRVAMAGLAGTLGGV